MRRRVVREATAEADMEHLQLRLWMRAIARGTERLTEARAEIEGRTIEIETEIGGTEEKVVTTGELRTRVGERMRKRRGARSSGRGVWNSLVKGNFS